MPLEQQASHHNTSRSILDPASEQQLMFDVVGLIHRRAALILTAAFITLAVAILYTQLAKPVYVAQAELIIEPRPLSILRTQNTVETAILETMQLENHISLLTSEHIINMVATDLKLASDPDLGSTTKAKAPTGKHLDKQQDLRQKREIMDAFQQRLQVRRIGLSSTISISYRSTSATQAADVANAVVDAYLRDEIMRQTRLATQGGQWLEERIEEVRIKMNAATLEVQAHRARRDYRIPTAVDGKAAPTTSRDITLEELELRASAYRRIYEGYFQGYFSSIHQQPLFLPNARVITRAIAPLGKANARPHVILPLSVVGGLLLGFVIAFLWDPIDSSIRNRTQIRGLGLAFLAEIPVGRTGAGNLGPRFQYDRLKAALTYWLTGNHQEAPTPIVQNVNSWEMNLCFQHVTGQLASSDGQPSARCIAITSVLPNEGKTTLSKGLAGAYAAAGLRTLLVDSDFEDATSSDLFGAGPKDGLLEILLGTREPAACIMTGGTGHPDLLPAGQDHDRAGALAQATGGRLRALVDELRATYDVVIFDSATLGSAQALTFDATVGGVIMVCEYARSTKSTLTDGLDLLMGQSALLLGAVINKSPCKIRA